jgi:hypothetical protein
MDLLGQRHQHRVAAAAARPYRRRAGLGGCPGPDQRPRMDAPVKDLGSLKLRNISRPVHAYMVGAGKRPRSTPAIDSFQRRRPSIAVLPFVEQSAVTANEAAETADSYFQRRPGRGHHLGVVVPARSGRDLVHVDAELPRHDTGPAAGPSRAARALHAVRQRAPRRRRMTTRYSGRPALMRCSPNNLRRASSRKA